MCLGKTTLLNSLIYVQTFWINLLIFIHRVRAKKHHTIKGENMTTMITMTAATTRARCFLKKSGINGNDRRNATTKTTTATFASLRNTNNDNNNDNDDEVGKIGKEEREDDASTTTSKRRQFALSSAAALASVALALGQPMDAEALSLKSSNKNGVYWIEPKVGSVFSSLLLFLLLLQNNEQQTHEQKTRLSSSSSS